VHLLTAHAGDLAVAAATPRREAPPAPPDEAVGEDALVAAVGVAATEPDPTGAAVAAAAVVARRRRQLSAASVLVVPAPSLVDAVAPAETTERAVATLVERLRAALAAEDRDPTEVDPTVEAAPVGHHLGVEGSLRGHPHALERHAVVHPPLSAPPAPAGPDPAWHRVGPDGRRRGDDAADPPAVPTTPGDRARERLAAVPGVSADGTWLPAGVAARRAVVERTVTAARERGAVSVARDADGAVPTVAGDVGGWIERSAPATGDATLYVDDGSTSAATAACEHLAAVVEALAVAPTVAVRTAGDAAAVAAAFDRPVLAGPAPAGDRTVDAVAFGPASLPVGRVWVDGNGAAAAVAPLAALAAAHEARSGSAEPLPVWLSPTTVRLVPVAGRHREGALAAVDALRARGVSADCDDRAETVVARLDRVDAEGVAYHAVVGDRELDGAADPETRTVPVVGPDGDQHTTSVAALAERVHEHAAAPTPGAVPRRLSRLGECANPSGDRHD
jgi:hypothetical protein